MGRDLNDVILLLISWSNSSSSRTAQDSNGAILGDFCSNGNDCILLVYIAHPQTFCLSVFLAASYDAETIDPHITKTQPPCYEHRVLEHWGHSVE